MLQNSPNFNQRQPSPSYISPDQLFDSIRSTFTRPDSGYDNNGQKVAQNSFKNNDKINTIPQNFENNFISQIPSSPLLPSYIVNSEDNVDGVKEFSSLTHTLLPVYTSKTQDAFFLDKKISSDDENVMNFSTLSNFSEFSELSSDFGSIYLSQGNGDEYPSGSDEDFGPKDGTETYGGGNQFEMGAENGFTQFENNEENFNESQHQYLHNSNLNESNSDFNRYNNINGLRFDTSPHNGNDFIRKNQFLKIEIQTPIIHSNILPDNSLSSRSISSSNDSFGSYGSDRKNKWEQEKKEYEEYLLKRKIENQIYNNYNNYNNNRTHSSESSSNLSSFRQNTDENDRSDRSDNLELDIGHYNTNYYHNNIYQNNFNNFNFVQNN
jgi:hypothetical protein